MTNIFFAIFKRPLFYLILIIVLALFVRLYRIEVPIADWHSWRQVDTAAVARNFYQEGYNPLLPKSDNMVGEGDPRLFNPKRLFLVEFPIYNSLVYFGYLIFGGVDVRIARMVSILFSLGSTVFVYLIAKRYLGTFTALLSALLYAILPFNVYFSRTTLPEPTFVFFSLGMIYFVDRWIKENTHKLFLIALFFTACAFLIKPYTLFYALPLLYSFYQKERKLWPIPKRYLIFVVLSLLPFGLWRFWISQFPEGIPAAGWLFNSNNIRFKPIFWEYLFTRRIAAQILGTTGTVLLFIGWFIKPLGKEGMFLHLWLTSAFLFFIVLATGNIQHNYYQYMLVPPLAIFTARGFSLLVSGKELFLPRIVTVVAAVLFLVMAIYTTWHKDKGFYQINNGNVNKAGDEANKILPKNAVVIAPYGGDTTLLYQINRHGFPVIVDKLPVMVEKYGATAFVSVAKDTDTKNAMQRYTILEDTPDFTIIDLTRPNPNFNEAVASGPK